MKRTLGISVTAMCLWACGASVMPLEALVTVDRIRDSVAVREAKVLAAEEFARAEKFRASAIAARQDGDEASAVLLAERAVAAYERALAVARLRMAETEHAGVHSERDKFEQKVREASERRAEVEREADALSAQIALITDKLLPANSGGTDPKREFARLTAARSLAMEARLLCGATRVLLEKPSTQLTEAETRLHAIEKVLDAPRKGSIDEAARVRALCLTSLTMARRESKVGEIGASDALLTELSSLGGWEPFRDERGVVVVLRGVFRDASLSDEGKQKLTTLSRLVGKYTGFGLELVTHESTPRAKGETALDSSREAALRGAFSATSLPAWRIRVEHAGSRLPIVDGLDTKVRARNERVEVVFVAPR